MSRSNWATGVWAVGTCSARNIPATSRRRWRQPIALPELQSALVGLRLADPDLNVLVRGDATTKYKQIRAVLDACQGANLPKVDLVTDPAGKKN